MFELKQFLPQAVCLECQGCCRFSEENSIWQPALLNEEIKIITKDNAAKEINLTTKKIKSLPCDDYHICSFFDLANKRCRIYNIRPLECRLYPFLINRVKDTIYLSLDLKCPFIKDKLEEREFKDYLNYLVSFLSLPVVSFAIRGNPPYLYRLSRR